MSNNEGTDHPVFHALFPPADVLGGPEAHPHVAHANALAHAQDTLSQGEIRSVSHTHARM